LLTGTFIDSCFSLLLNQKTKIRRNKSLYKDINDIITFCESQQTLKVPIDLEVKLDLLKEVCKLLIEGRTVPNIIDSVSFTEKFSQYRQELLEFVKEDLKEHQIQDIIDQVRMRKKINALLQNQDQISVILDSVKDWSFTSMDELVSNYEGTVKKMYSNLVESNRAVQIEAASSLDFIKDDFEPVVEMIKTKYKPENRIPTGFPLFDKDIMGGGYERSRLYIYGGGGGAGKSTMLNNTIYLSAQQPRLLSIDGEVREVGTTDKVYIYITLENSLEEALMRTYQPMFDRTSAQMLTEIGKHKTTKGAATEIASKIGNQLKKNGANIIMKFFPGKTVSAIDLMGVVDDAIEEYGKESICGLFIDYLDLLLPDVKSDLYRLELGNVTLSLKTLAVHYNIPVVTATQLGRSAYEIQQSDQLGVQQISESIKKVEHSDFVMLLGKDPHDKHLVHGKVVKNRSGESNVSFDFAVDFAKYKFENGVRIANPKKPDSTTENSCSSSFYGWSGT
jgi:replicative DNA helicase